LKEKAEVIGGDKEKYGAVLLGNRVSRAFTHPKNTIGTGKWPLCRGAGGGREGRRQKVLRKLLQTAYGVMRGQPLITNKNNEIMTITDFMTLSSEEDW